MTYRRLRPRHAYAKPAAVKAGIGIRDFSCALLGRGWRAVAGAGFARRDEDTDQERSEICPGAQRNWNRIDNTMTQRCTLGRGSKHPLQTEMLANVRGHRSFICPRCADLSQLLHASAVEAIANAEKLVFLSIGDTGDVNIGLARCIERDAPVGEQAQAGAGYHDDRQCRRAEPVKQPTNPGVPSPESLEDPANSDCWREGRFIGVSADRSAW
jgi:hypothetical protein